jgi:GH15 family glucan-1,4-alpha-glucosidase
MMPAERRLEDYALIGDCETAALVGRDGSIDWLCFPRFDGPACFAALLGTAEHGRFRIAPRGPCRSVRRSYRPGTLVLETTFETDAGGVTVIDFMPPREKGADVVRIVRGDRGRVALDVDLRARFDYGSVVPWVQPCEGGFTLTAGPDQLRVATSVPLSRDGDRIRAGFEVGAGDTIAFDLTWAPSHQQAPAGLDADRALEATVSWWEGWCARCAYTGEHREAVARSLITLKALTYAPTGGIVAAPTTSLPEHLGGVRNWDYRYCWLRDATFTLLVLLDAGYVEEAQAFREWLLRATAGLPSQVHIMYGVAGERRLPEVELPWLPGFASSTPVRVGNAAHAQFQLDVFGEVMDVLHQCYKRDLRPGRGGWELELALMEFVERAWCLPDEGIWEVRGPRRSFTHSKVMAWVAVDRAIQGVERFGLEGPVDRWRALRTRIHDEVCRLGYDAERESFVQYYGARDLDASLLMIPLVGFLPIEDARVQGTIRAIERELVTDGFVARYRTDPAVDGLPEGESSFLLCSFWMVDCLILSGRREEARALFDRLLGVRNDVGLLSESYDVDRRRLTGNFPQAFSHVGLVNSALLLGRTPGPSAERADG